jgi:hypothetical protein
MLLFCRSGLFGCRIGELEKCLHIILAGWILVFTCVAFWGGGHVIFI